MKITKQKLKQIIKEELEEISRKNSTQWNKIFGKIKSFQKISRMFGKSKQIVKGAPLSGPRRRPQPLGVANDL